MLPKVLVCCALLMACILAQQPAPATSQSVKAEDIDAELADKLLKSKRVFVESFGEDAANKSLQAMVLDAVRRSKRFIVTENKEKADLILKGAALEKTSQELHAIGSATAVAGASGGHHSSVVGHASQSGSFGSASISGSSSGGFLSRSAGIEDSQASTETISEARVAVRLVSPDGDVVWSTTQESRGAKYKSAAADVADKVVVQLLRDLDKLISTRSNQK